MAWVGIYLVADLKPGETFVISGSGGGIGQLAGQYAKARGARVIGIASGERCRYVVDELGFDACIDRKREDFGARLDALCPDGIDVYFENVGSEVGRLAFDRLARFGRMVICGFAGEYGRSHSDLPTFPILAKALRVQGFVVYDHYDRFDDFSNETIKLLNTGRMRCRDRVVEGLQSFPDALRSLQAGHVVGKLLVQIGPDPTVSAAGGQEPAVPDAVSMERTMR